MSNQCRFKLKELHCNECGNPTGEEGICGDWTMCAECRKCQTLIVGEDWAADIIIRNIDAPGKVAQHWKPGVYDEPAKVPNALGDTDEMARLERELRARERKAGV